MGIYFAVYPNPCPRCGGSVSSTFISVSPMNFSIGCSGCDATDFSEEEMAALGKAKAVFPSREPTEEEGA